MRRSTPSTSAEWIPTAATVTGCRRTYATWFVNEASPDEVGTYSLAKFRIDFEYLVNGKAYAGHYEAGAPKEIGSDFQILTDPRDPARNTGSDAERSLPAKAVILAVAIGLLVALMKIFPDAGW